jgi:hypothetical protein
MPMGTKGCTRPYHSENAMLLMHGAGSSLEVERIDLHAADRCLVYEGTSLLK